MQANWPLERSLDEVKWVQAQHEETGWPSAIVGSADLFEPARGETLEAQAEASPLMRGCRLQLHWHEHEAFRFAEPADACSTRSSTRTWSGSPSAAGCSSCRCSRTSSRTRRELLGAHPDLTFVLIHAGMPIEGEPWREACTSSRSTRTSTSSCPARARSSTASTPDWIRTVTQVVVDTFGSERAMFGTNFPVESIWTDFSSLVKAWFGVFAELPAGRPGRHPRPDRAPRIQARGGIEMTRPVQHTASAVAGWLREGRRVAAGLLVEVEGSSPLDVGASMYIDDQGGIEGSITGGCVEGAVAAAAMEMLEAGGAPQLVTYGISDELAGHGRPDVRRDRPHLHPRAPGRAPARPCWPTCRRRSTTRPPGS